MSQEKTTLELMAPTVDEAIANGLNQLGLDRESVDVEIIDQGSRGLFGIGSRQARVKVSVIEKSVKQTVANLPAVEIIPIADVPKPVNKPNPVLEPAQETDKTLSVARQVVAELLEKMKINATLKVGYQENGDPRDRETVVVDIEGNDLSILIGRRSETLYALQYIAGLIISKELNSLVPLVIDVQGYRSRRERQLQQMARRMADQAVHTGKRQSLEPMPANERRIIHIELRDHEKVTTESVGEEPNRKVTIIPKK
jgi:spoIIIJ-associated protein